MLSRRNVRRDFLDNETILAVAAIAAPPALSLQVISKVAPEPFGPCPSCRHGVVSIFKNEKQRTA
jgi:hypothetical protein